MKRMTYREALLEARRRWGDNGYVYGRRLPKRTWYSVGVSANRMYTRKGKGDSWEAAFADADSREGGKVNELDKTYLGDSVYAEVENGMIKLTTENGFGPTNTIFLEGFVITNLNEYVARLASARDR
jgi:hypothetical protein